jgi:hypothetical protein
MDLRLATLKAVSFHLLHNISTLNKRRKLSCGTVVCKHFASYSETNRIEINEAEAWLLSTSV